MRKNVHIVSSFVWWTLLDSDGKSRLRSPEPPRPLRPPPTRSPVAMCSPGGSPAGLGGHDEPRRQSADKLPRRAPLVRTLLAAGLLRPADTLRVAAFGRRWVASRNRFRTTYLLFQQRPTLRFLAKRSHLFGRCQSMAKLDSTRANQPATPRSDPWRLAIIMLATRFASWGVAAICRGCCLSARPTRYNKALRVPRGLPAELPDSPLRN